MSHKKRKKKKGSIIKYVDKKGHEDRTYEIKRDEGGHFDKFKRIAGLSSAPKAQRLSAKQLKNLKTIARAHRIIWAGVNDELRTLNEPHLIGEGRVKLWEFINANGYMISDTGRLIKKIH